MSPGLLKLRQGCCFERIRGGKLLALFPKKGWSGWRDDVKTETQDECYECHELKAKTELTRVNKKLPGGQVESVWVCGGCRKQKVDNKIIFLIFAVVIGVVIYLLET